MEKQMKEWRTSGYGDVDLSAVWRLLLCYPPPQHPQRPPHPLKPQPRPEMDVLEVVQMRLSVSTPAVASTVSHEKPLKCVGANGPCELIDGWLWDLAALLLLLCLCLALS